MAKKKNFPITIYISRDTDGTLLTWERPEEALKIDPTKVAIYELIEVKEGRLTPEWEEWEEES